MVDNNDILKIIPLGGVGNVTKNMYLYEYRDEIIIIDSGVGFPDEGMPGVDFVIPDISYLLDKKEKVKGILLTHGHEDHIGALPFLVKEFQNVPIYASLLTAGLAEEKLKEDGINKKIEIITKNNSLSLGSFTVEWIHMTHSIPDTLNFLIHTPIGTIYHGSDFKFDWTPVDGKITEVGKIASAGDKGIICLLTDCLGSERRGYTLSEQIIEETLQREINNCEGKFIVTTQSSNISRLQQAIKVALKNNRFISMVGRSIEKNLEVAQRLNYISIPKEKIVRTENISKYPPKSLMLLVAGSQGQESSALSRIANGDHPQIKIENGDVIVFSSDPIPGNENAVYNLIDTLSRLGARISYSDVLDDLHVSGHGSINELLLLLALTKPKFIFPIGGTYRHMQQYSLLAQKMGYKENQIILGNNGQTLDVAKDIVKLGQKIEMKNIMVDGLGIGDVGNVVLRDRKVMSEDGIVVVIIPLEENTARQAGEPDIISRGFVYMKESESLIGEAKKVIQDTISSQRGKITEWQFLKKKVEDNLAKFLFKKTKRRPMIVPVIIEV